MADKTVKVRLEAATASYQAAMRRASVTTNEFARNVSGMGNVTDENLKRVSRGALIAAGGLAVGLGLSAKAAISWESAWAGVTKTVDGSTEQLAGLQDGLRDMAKELPATHAEIAGVAEAAGQLGIKVGDVEDFTRVMIDLGETTNISATEAATSLARLANMTGTSARDFERLGSTVVALGNNSETTEAEIVGFAEMIAATGTQAGLSEADLFAFAATMTSVGVKAERGGTALNKVFTAIGDSVIDGGEKLEVFANTANMTAAEFTRAFREDPAMAIQSFIVGLGDMAAAGESTTATFEALELTDQRLMQALKATGAAGTHLADRILMANEAWEENNALQTEAEKRYETTGAQLEMLRNKAVDFGIDLGSVMLPAINATVGGLGDMLEGFSALPGPMQTAGVGLATVATVGLGAIGVLGTLGPMVVKAKAALESMGVAGNFVSRNMGRMATGVGIAAVALAGISYIAGQQAKKAAEADARVKSWAEAIREAGDAARGAVGYLSQLAEDTPDLAIAMAEAGVTVDEMAAALNEGGEAWDRMVGAIGNGARAAGLSDGAMFKLAGTLLGMAGEGAKAEEIAAALEKTLGTSGTAADGAAGDMDHLTGSLDDQADAAQEAKDAIAALIEEYQAPLTPFFAMQDAMDAIEDASRDAAKAQRDVADAQAAVGEAQRDAQRKVASAQREAVSAAQAVEEAQMDVAEAMSMVADEAEAARKGISDLASEQQASVDPLFGMLDALQKQRDLLAKTGDDKASPLDIAKGAAGVNEAATRLAGAIHTGDVSIEESRQMLDTWVAQGLITADQANEVAKQFANAAGRAKDLQGANVAGAASAEVAAERLRVEGERADAVAAAQDRVREAMEKAAEAQERVAEASVEGAEAVAEAQGNLADAIDRAADAERDSERRAMDLMVASIALSGAMKSNAGAANDMKARIKEMADQGLITRDRANELADAIDHATEMADLFAGDYVARLFLDASKFWEGLANARFGLAMTQIEAQLDNPYAQPIGGIPLAAGGLVPQYLAAGGVTHGPKGTDTVPIWGTPGEYMMNKGAVDQYGVGFMDAINAGQFRGIPGGGSSSTTVTNDNRTVNYSATVVAGDKPAMTAVRHTLRKLELAHGGD